MKMRFPFSSAATAKCFRYQPMPFHGSLPIIVDGKLPHWYPVSSCRMGRLSPRRLIASSALPLEVVTRAAAAAPQEPDNSGADIVRDPTEIPALVGIMDVLVHLSRREGLARALPQALAAGRPVIAFDCDGAREVCLDGKTGFLISPGDNYQLTRRLLELVGDTTLREDLGTAGRNFVREHFAAERMVDELHQLYLRLARKS